MESSGISQHSLKSLDDSLSDQFDGISVSKSQYGAKLENIYQRGIINRAVLLLFLSTIGLRRYVVGLDRDDSRPVVVRDLI
jgi:hypothetical protein